MDLALQITILAGFLMTTILLACISYQLTVIARQIALLAQQINALHGINPKSK